MMVTQILIESRINERNTVNLILIADLGLRKPSSYAEISDILVEHGLLSGDEVELG